MTTELIAYLLSWAVFYTGYPMPEQLPTINYVEREYFVNSPLCRGIDTINNPCTVRAMYGDNTTGILYVNKQFKNDTDAHTKSIIVHEMVHYLQDLSGDWENMDTLTGIRLCEAWMSRQREAYTVEDLYLADVHDRHRLLRREYARCEN